MKACLCPGRGWVGDGGGARSQEVVDERGVGGGGGLVGLDSSGEVKEDCHRNDVRDKAIIP